MSLETISEKLIRLGICPSTLSANTTATYAILWMAGQRQDTSKRAVQTHRARLRKIGIDIAMKCDLSRHSVAYVKQAREVSEQNLLTPHWYENPRTQLKLVA